MSNSGGINSAAPRALGGGGFGLVALSVLSGSVFLKNKTMIRDLRSNLWGRANAGMTWCQHSTFHQLSLALQQENEISDHKPAEETTKKLVYNFFFPGP